MLPNLNLRNPMNFMVVLMQSYMAKKVQMLKHMLRNGKYHLQVTFLIYI